MTEDLAVSAGEVRVTARFPHRSSLAFWALIAAGFGLSLWLVGRSALPGQATDPPLDGVLCQAEPTPEACLDGLPPELRGLPEPSQYERWRRWDLAQQLEMPMDLPLSDQAFWLQRSPPSDRERVVEALQRLDGWSDWRVTALASPKETEQALVELAAERDWAAPVPELQVLPTEAELEARYLGVDLLVAHEVLEHNQESRRLATEVVAGYGALYERQRHRLIQQRWAWDDLQDLKDELQEVGDDLRGVGGAQAEAWVMFQALAAACLVFSALLGAAWAWLRPVQVVAGLHHLQLGPHKLPWTEIQRISWGGGEAEVLTANHFYTLWPRVVLPQAKEALAQASQQALARSRTLRPLDERALDSVRRLGQIRET